MASLLQERQLSVSSLPSQGLPFSLESLHPTQHPRSQFSPGVEVQLPFLEKQQEGGLEFKVCSLSCCLQLLSKRVYVFFLTLLASRERGVTVISQLCQVTDLSLQG